MKFFQKYQLPKIWQSLIFICLLFFLSLITPITIAQIIPTTTIQIIESAKINYQQGNYNNAVPLWQQAANLFAKQGDNLNQAMALSNLSLTYQKQGKWTEAKSKIAESLDLLKKQPKTTEKLQVLSQSLEIQAQLQREIGESNAALKTWQQATDIYTHLNQSERKIKSEINQAKTLQDLGLYPRACQSLLQTLSIDLTQISKDPTINIQNCQSLSQLNQKERGKIAVNFQEMIQNQSESLFTNLIPAWVDLSHVLQVMGNLELSEKIQESLIKYLRIKIVADNSHSNKDLTLQLSRVYLNLGNNYRLQQKTESALDNYEKAIKIVQNEASDYYTNLHKIQAKVNRINLLVVENKLQEVNKKWQNLLQDIEALPATQNKAYAQLNLVQSLMCWQHKTNQKNQEIISPVLQSCQNQNTKTEFSDDPKPPNWQVITNILNQAEQLDNAKIQSYVKGYQAAIAQEQGNLSQAEELTKTALNLAGDNPNVAYRWQWQLARLYNNHPESVKFYQNAYNNLQNLRQDLVAIHPDVQFNFRDSVEPMYREYVDLLLRDIDDLLKTDSEKGQEQLRTAREVIEDLQLAELNDFFQDACTDVKKESIDDIDPEVGVIYSIILSNRIETIFKLPKQETLYHKAVAIKQQDVENKIKEIFVKYLFIREMVADKIPDLHQLTNEIHQWLIEPFETKLQEQKQLKPETLVFVLDGILRRIPIAVIYDMKSEKYVVEKYATAITPGIRLFSSQPSDNLLKNQAFIGGVSKKNKKFKKLPHVKSELTQINSTLSLKNPPLLNEQFQKQSIQKQINSNLPRIIHFATHGKFDSNPEKTFILAWGEELNIKELENILKDNERTEKNPIELLVLSACETAEGNNRAILGLAGMAVRSGARSTLASLWKVEDTATANLMKEFYTELTKNPTSRAKALQKAQLKILNNSDNANWKKPYFWAAFVLVGNWN